MAIGYDRPLYILPFDHRGTFQKNMFGWSGTISAEQTQKIADMKKVIYDGFKAALAGGVPEAKAGILVDEQFGSEILADAAKHGYNTSCPAEKSGQDEFDFEYGEQFGAHIEKFRPTFCKVLVRYNPESDAAMNKRQAERLARLSKYLHDGGQSKFMFELLVPAEKSQLEKVGGDKKRYDRELRPSLMIQAIHDLQESGVEADVWKIEGIETVEDGKKVVAAMKRGGREHVGAIILGRGEDETKVRHWLKTAGEVPGFIGFAVGRTTFWDPCAQWKEGKLTRDAAVAEIARRYRDWCDIFDSASARA